RERIALPLDLFQHVGKLRFDDQQALVADTRVRLHLLIANRSPALLDALAFGDRITHRPDEPLAGGQPALHALVVPRLLCRGQEGAQAPQLVPWRPLAVRPRRTTTSFAW